MNDLLNNVFTFIILGFLLIFAGVGIGAVFFPLFFKFAKFCKELMR